MPTPEAMVRERQGMSTWQRRQWLAVVAMALATSGPAALAQGASAPAGTALALGTPRRIRGGR